jgi:hypothetical protein
MFNPNHEAMKRFVLFSFILTAIMSVYAQDSDEELIKVLDDFYNTLSVDKGEAYDWDKVRTFFHDEATVVLRTSFTASTVFSVDGFINDFKKFVADAKITETGFTERIVKKEVTVVWDIAHLFVVYEAIIPGTDRQPQRGLDSMHFIKVDGKWKIMSIINEIPTPQHPLPDRLKN